MTIIELARAFLQEAAVGVCITDAQVTRPGPIVVYANPAFARLRGHEQSEIIGRSPRFMQGRETRRSTLDTFARSLAAGESFHGYLTNYRGDGTKYIVEMDCRPIRGLNAEVQHFISFEREVARRKGRPGPGSAGRYDPVSVSNDQLTDALRAMGAFSGPMVSAPQVAEKAKTPARSGAI